KVHARRINADLRTPELDRRRGGGIRHTRPPEMLVLVRARASEGLRRQHDLELVRSRWNAAYQRSDHTPLSLQCEDCQKKRPGGVRRWRTESMQKDLHEFPVQIGRDLEVNA